MKNLHREAFTIKESQCTLIADKPEGIQTAKHSLERHRRELEAYIKDTPNFLYTLTPVPVPSEPLVAKIMAEAAKKANVGPMAAVAGALVDLAVRDIISVGCNVAVVEDGGEVTAMSNEPIDVAVVLGDAPLSKRFGFRLTEFPIGIATSSGRFSHAFSFGDAEAATIFCRNAALADAAATAVCNVVKGENWQAAIQAGIKKALSIQGVEGVLIIYNGFTGTAGKIPTITKINPENKT